MPTPSEVGILDFDNTMKLTKTETGYTILASEGEVLILASGLRNLAITMRELEKSQAPSGMPFFKMAAERYEELAAILEPTAQS